MSSITFLLLIYKRMNDMWQLSGNVRATALAYDATTRLRAM
jgi:hypothetical protein